MLTQSDQNRLALSSLATQIQEAHQECLAEFDLSQNHAQRSLLKAKHAGELLTQAKGRLRHGQWLGWLTENCSGVSRTQAQRYMLIYREFEELEQSPEFESLSFSRALAILKPETIEPEEIEAELVEPEATEAKQASKSQPVSIGETVRIREDSGLPEAGEEVKIVSRKNGLLEAESGLLLMPNEIESVQPQAPKPEPPPRLTPSQQNTYFRGLLQKILIECQLPAGLRAEVETAIG